MGRHGVKGRLHTKSVQMPATMGEQGAQEVGEGAHGLVGPKAEGAVSEWAHVGVAHGPAG